MVPCTACSVVTGSAAVELCVRTSSCCDACALALCSSSASFSSSLTASPSAEYSFLMFSFMRALLSMSCAAACRNLTRCCSVLISSVISQSG